MANGFLPLLRYLHRMAANSPGGGLTDGQLLERFVRQQDEAAFAVLLQRHAKMVWNVCSRILRDPHQTEDAFQATFLVLVRKAGSIAHGERLANWLYGVAFRVAKKAKVQTGKRQAHRREMPDMPSKNPTDQLGAVLDDEMRHLPAKYREPLVLCYLEGLSSEEAARQLGCPEGTLRSWLTRAREMLRQRLLRRGMVVPAAGLASLLAENAASAAVPPGVVDSTLAVTHALLTAGQQTTFGLASASVAALTEGVLKDMLFIKLKIAAGFLAAAVVLAGSGWVALADKTIDQPAANKPEEGAKDPGPVVSAEYAKWRDYVLPSPSEQSYRKIAWRASVLQGVVEAQKQDKPLMILLMNGHPLGCT